MTPLSRAYSEGRAARLRFTSQDANPYSYGTNEYWAWRFGWIDAANEQ